MRALACLPLLAGCSQLLGLDNLHQNAAGSDAATPPPDVVTPIDDADGPPISIHGMASTTQDLNTGQQPAAGTKVDLVRVSDESLVTSTITDTTGAFSFTVPAGSDIMVRTSDKAPFAVVLPAAPPTADTDLSFTTFSDQALAQLGSLCPAQTEGVDPSLGQVFVQLVDATNTPQAGYSVTSALPGKVTCYPLGSGAGATGSQGTAIVLDVGAGIDTISAIDATGPVATSRAWVVPARSQSFLRLEVPTHPTP